MNLQALEDVLKQWLQPLLPTGIPSNPVAFYAADGRQPMLSPTLKAAAYYSFTSIRQVGEDETTFANNVVTGRLAPTISGNRYPALTIRFDSMDQRPNLTAQYLAERARTRLKMPKVLENLALAGYGLVDTGPILQLPFPVDDRLFSRAVFELTLAVLAIETETDVDNELDRVDVLEVASDQLEFDDGTPTEQVDLTITRP